MVRKPLEMLLVSGDTEFAEMISGYLGQALRGNVTLAESASAALREELTTRHELVITDLALPDGDGLELVRQIRVANRCPVLLMAEAPTPAQLIEAMRLKVCDVFVHPFDLADLAESAERVVASARQRRCQRRRYNRLRVLTARIIRERRDLRQRIDLICQDVVRAYQRLARKVTDSDALTCE